VISKQSGSGIRFAHVIQARFSCGVCGKIFFQQRSFSDHHSRVHGTELTGEDLIRSTRSEYATAIEKLRLPPEGKKRRRRKHRRNEHSDTSKYRTAVELAEKLSPGNTHTYSIASQILGEPESIIRMKLSSSRVIAFAEARKPNITITPPVMTSLSLLVTLHGDKIYDSDISELESFITSLGVDPAALFLYLSDLNRNGVLAKRKSGSRPGLVSFTISKVGKESIFGKFVEVEKLGQILEIEATTATIDSEPEFASAINYKLLDGTLDVHFDQAGVDDDERSTDSNDEDDDGLLGISKHLSISESIGGDIVSVSCVPRRESVTDVTQCFISVLLRRTKNSPNVWRIKEDEEGEIGEKDESFMTAPSGDVTLGGGICLNVVQTPAETVYVSRFLQVVFEASPEFFHRYSNQGRGGGRVQLGAWMSLDGDIDQQILADLLMSITCMIHNSPGIDSAGIVKNMAIVPEGDVLQLIKVLVNTGMIDEVKGELFVAFNDI
jgi:hypothetical protein